MMERMWGKGNTPALLVGVLWKSVWQFLIKLGSNLLQDPAIPLLSMVKALDKITSYQGRGVGIEEI